MIITILYCKICSLLNSKISFQFISSIHPTHPFRVQFLINGILAYFSIILHIYQPCFSLYISSLISSFVASQEESFGKLNWTSFVKNQLSEHNILHLALCLPFPIPKSPLKIFFWKCYMSRIHLNRNIGFDNGFPRFSISLLVIAIHMKCATAKTIVMAAVAFKSSGFNSAMNFNDCD